MAEGGGHALALQPGFDLIHTARRIGRDDECEIDGLDYGTCPTGMTCTSVPGQDPSVSLCMW